MVDQLLAPVSERREAKNRNADGNPEQGKPRLRIARSASSFVQSEMQSRQKPQEGADGFSDPGTHRRSANRRRQPDFDDVSSCDVLDHLTEVGDVAARDEQAVGTQTHVAIDNGRRFRLGNDPAQLRIRCDVDRQASRRDRERRISEVEYRYAGLIRGVGLTNLTSQISSV